MMQLDMEHKPNRLKILIVDDRKENLFSMKSLLSEIGGEILCASSGNEALSFMLDHEFALAILDVQMPVMNGFELAQLMRGADRTKNVPIIFVTAGVSTAISEFKGYESGAVDFLPKPLNPEILKAKVRVFLELAEQRVKLNQKVLELEKLSQEAAAAKETAEQANRLKSSFLANMSHEIRTPLGALMGFAELLKEDLPENEKDKYVDVILRNGKALVQIIDEILDLSKIEAGHIEIENETVEPVALLEDLKIFMTPLAEKKKLHLDLNLSSNLPKKIGTDSLRFRQILTNLLGNAIKFTEWGRVSLTLDYLSKDDGGEVICKIEDTGIGIPEGFASRLFQPFSQGDVSITRSFGGTGLGLSLSRKLAELLGGGIRLVSSEPNVGSVFEVRVEDRLALVKTGRSRQKKSGGVVHPSLSGHLMLKGLNILVVDDSPDNQLFVQMLLTSQGAEVSSANNGQEGVSKACDGSFDLVLMDLQMPVCDGLKATKTLRENGYKKPILALTANAMKEEKERCLRVGFNSYVSKPIDKKVLFEEILQSLQKNGNQYSTQKPEVQL